MPRYALIRSDRRLNDDRRPRSSSCSAPSTGADSSVKTVTGFVFTHREGGLKLLQVGLQSGSAEFLFRFVQPVGGVTYFCRHLLPATAGACRRRQFGP
jgi:hypothetical protein